MIAPLKVWGRLKWPVLRAHLCTLAISVSFNATWRVPREAFLYGGLTYGLALTAMLVLVALPITLLHLAIGQLSQQDAVGIWRAVPFFRGIGYIRLLISYVGSTYSVLYLSLTIAYFLYTATHNIPFIDCIELVEMEEEYINVLNASECLRITFMSPVNESPEYYLAIALVVAVLWIASPFVFYSSIKLMKRIMYLLSPAIIVLGIVIAACVGNGSSISTIVDRGSWRGFAEPYLWISAVVQALWSCQLAGGFLIVAGDSVYASTNVQWTSIVITCTNIISSWFWLIFWHSISGSKDKYTSAAAVLVQVYQAVIDGELEQEWVLLVYFTLILSGTITMLVLLYPVYDRFRRIGGVKWRLASFAASLVGAGVSLAILGGRLRVLTLLENLAMPLLISLATGVEILALGFIYGWKNLVKDVEFLTGSQLLKYWVWGWWFAPVVIFTVTTWWLSVIIISYEDAWMAEESITVLAAAVVAAAVFVLCACIAVGRQVQYDILDKLKSSFQPSRHWGPRDPITHYYWLARREDLDRGNVPRTRYNRRELGQFSRGISFLTETSRQSDLNDENNHFTDIKQRSNSDDWLYTTGRKECLEIYTIYDKKRSMSVDWDVPRKSTERKVDFLGLERNNNIVGFKYINTS